jgi:hypothetical protein
MMVRFSIVSASLIAMFWGVWHMVMGQVPEVDSIQITQTQTINLPFSISRWWDVLSGPIWSILLILLFTRKKIKTNRNDQFTCAVVTGILACLTLESLSVGIGAGLTLGFFAIFLFSILFGLREESWLVSVAIGIGSVLGVGLSISIFSGLAGAVYGIIVFAFLEIAFALSDRTLWIKIYSWLLAK